ncbi:MAG: NusG domain II-containing protein [Coriobacteriaceae bacterium]|nr:NusG domain II-containing protein [Coriobacteriaceae bacterium]
MKICLKKGDILLGAALLLACAAGAFWYVYNSANGVNSSANGMLVVTQSSDGFYRCDPLGADAEFLVRTPGTGAGRDAEQGKNRVRIHNGSVQVIESNCGNQTCVEHAAISGAGEQIVCLPHQLVVEVVANEADASRLH